MSVKKAFDPEKLSIADFKLLRFHIETPETFSTKNIKGHQLENSLQLAFNIDDKLVKIDFTFSITTESEGANDNEANGNFHLVYVFKVENLEDLITGDNNSFTLDSDLANALSSISYSTTRGVLLTRLQGTALNNFMLPVINPNRLLH